MSRRRPLRGVLSPKTRMGRKPETTIQTVGDNSCCIGLKSEHLCRRKYHCHFAPVALQIIGQFQGADVIIGHFQGAKMTHQDPFCIRHQTSYFTLKSNTPSLTSLGRRSLSLSLVFRNLSPFVCRGILVARRGSLSLCVVLPI